MGKNKITALKEKRWTETSKDLIKKLKKFGRCCVLRCTGFGKTWIASALTTKYDNIVYVYPSEVIKDTAEKRIIASHLALNNFPQLFDVESVLEKITFVTYTWLSLHYTDKKALKKLGMDKDLIIFDECHLMGGQQVKEACKFLINTYEGKAKFVGLTATPIRQDGFDVVTQFFSNVVTKSYTLHDAIRDKIILKPIYVYCTFEGMDNKGNIKYIEKNLLEKANLGGQKVKNPRVKELLKKRAVEIANIFNMPNIIRDVCTQEKRTDDFMEFICFFSSVNQLEAKMPDVVSWFQSAFPKKKIDALRIDSSKEKYRKNVEKLDNLSKDKNTIRLICCIDMLNLGYHVKDITGILMYRATKSSIIYIQQLGRALSTGDKKPCIVFDVVDNLHRETLFNVERRKPNHTNENMNGSTSAPYIVANTKGRKVGKNILAPINMSHLTEDARIELEELLAQKEEEKSWVTNPVNVLNETDIVASPHNAKYKELMAKTVAEPIVMASMHVVETLFHAWCVRKGVPYPCNRDEVIEMMYKGRDGLELFRKYLSMEIDKHNYDFPLLDAQKLLDLKKENIIYNLKYYADFYHVTVKQVVDIICKN